MARPVIADFAGLVAGAIVMVALAALLSAGGTHARGPDAPGLSASGRIERDDTRLGVTAPGTVQSIAVQAGDAVREGQVLLRLDDGKLASPKDGVCSAVNVRPGEVALPGQILIKVADDRSTYLRAFVPEGSIGRVKTGQRADVFLDSDPDKPLRARVVEIDATASFTPENVYFKEDRVRQVFGVKLAIESPDGSAKPGMPADAIIHVGREQR